MLNDFYYCELNMLLQSAQQDRIESVQSVLNYAMMGSGPLTVMGGVEGLAFVNTKYANASHDWPDIELHFISGSTSSDGGNQIRKAHGLREDFYDEVSSFSLLVILLQYLPIEIWKKIR